MLSTNLKQLPKQIPAGAPAIASNSGGHVPGHAVKVLADGGPLPGASHDDKSRPPRSPSSKTEDAEQGSDTVQMIAQSSKLALSSQEFSDSVCRNLSKDFSFEDTLAVSESPPPAPATKGKGHGACRAPVSKGSDGD